MEKAPIALFVFNRPEHTLRTLEGLAANAEFEASPVFVFCDGPRADRDLEKIASVRNIVRSFRTAKTQIVEQSSNLGLARSISEGVTRICMEHGRSIVVEDDLFVSRYFLEFMNAGLEKFADSECVMQVSGHCFDTLNFSKSDGSSFLPFITSWGWATWQRAWRLYDPSMTGYRGSMTSRETRQRFDLEGAYSYSRMIGRLEAAGRLNSSWGVRWYWSVFRNGGLVLYPHRSLVYHFGDDGSGTNYRRNAPSTGASFSTSNRVVQFPREETVDRPFFEDIKRTLRRENSFVGKCLRVVKGKFMDTLGSVRNA